MEKSIKENIAAAGRAVLSVTITNSSCHNSTKSKIVANVASSTVFLLVDFTIVSQILSGNTSLAFQTAKTLIAVLNTAIASGAVTSSIKAISLQLNQADFASSNVTAPSALQTVSRRAFRTASPSVQPAQGPEPEILSSANVAIIAAIGGFLLILAAAVLVFFCFFRGGEEPAKEKVTSDDVVIQFDAEYPVKEDVQAELNLTTESRRILQRIYNRKKNEKGEAIVDIFHNDNYGTLPVYINRARELYLDKRAVNSKMLKPLVDLTVVEVSKLLGKLDMAGYVDLFKSYGINGTTLFEIESLEDLRECDIAMPAPLARAFVKDLVGFRVNGVEKKILA